MKNLNGSNGSWVTINGTHVFIEKGVVTKGPANLVNKHIRSIESDREDGITLYSSLDSWARNASGIRRASNGERPNNSIWSVTENQVVKSEIIEQYIKDNPKINKTIYRGVGDLSDEDFKKLTTIGNEIDQKGTSSWSTDKGTAVGRTTGKNGVLFVQEGSNNARKLADAFTTTDIEAEVIMSVKARQRVVKTENMDNYTKVFVEEVLKNTKNNKRR